MMFLGVVSCLLLFVARQGREKDTIRKVPKTKKETMVLLSILEKGREKSEKE